MHVFATDRRRVAGTGPVPEREAWPAQTSASEGPFERRRLQAAIQSSARISGSASRSRVTADADDGRGIRADPTAGDQGQYAALNGPVGALADGNGYLMIGCGGGIFSFSDRPSLGSLGENPPPNPIVAVATWQA